MVPSRVVLKVRNCTGVKHMLNQLNLCLRILSIKQLKKIIKINPTNNEETI